MKLALSQDTESPVESGKKEEAVNRPGGAEDSERRDSFAGAGDAKAMTRRTQGQNGEGRQTHFMPAYAIGKGDWRITERIFGYCMEETGRGSESHAGKRYDREGRNGGKNELFGTGNYRQDSPELSGMQERKT
ncbi:MAG: hypothetical protein R3B95_08275 [Nitrospirales bacterium]|nr:hypothetical protein [Nitrospirales bacterium]